MQTTRTWLQINDIRQPVEWGVYGDKLSIISLGNEFVGMIIESPQIAASFREILDLLDRSVRTQPGYDQLPINHRQTKRPEVK